MNKGELIDYLVRVTTIIIRGLFIFASAKYLTVEEFGLYVAITAVIAWLQYAVAGDYSYIAHRELFKNQINFSEMVRTQAVLMTILYIITIPIALTLIPSVLEKDLIILTLIILLFESITSELQRHLVSVSRFTRANLMLFIKSAGWMLPSLFIFDNISESNNHRFILNAWILGLSLSLIFGVLSIKDYLVNKSKVNKNLIKLYFNKAMIILMGTLAARSLFSVDRIIVEKYIGVELVGAYGLFVGIAAGFIAVIDSGILTRSYPKLVVNALNNPLDFQKLSRNTQVKTLIISIVAIFMYYILINEFMRYLSKENLVLLNHVGAILIAAYGIYSLSFSLNCWFYATNRDKIITMINISALIPLLIYSVNDSISIFGVAISVLLCASLHYIIRILYMTLSDKRFV